MKSLNILLIFQILFISSCASILKGTDETIYVRSEVPDTKLYLNNELLGTGIGQTTIEKKRLKSAKLIAVKDGCRTAIADIETRLDSTTLLGLFLDMGIVSILIVDWGLYGSVSEAKKLSYVLNPKCP